MGRPRTLVAGLVLAVVCGAARHRVCAQELYTATFARGAQGWVGRNQASVSDVARRPGTKSLMISQWKDAQRDSHWLSPPIANPGGPMLVSFWAADNYLRCDDFSYSASMELVDCDADGKEKHCTQHLLQIPWDDKRKQAILWGQLLPEGLVWQHYRVVHSVRGKTFRLKLQWPKAIVRGDVYVTDVRVVTATADTIAAAKPRTEGAEHRKSRWALELSTPVGANLFLKGVPLRFEVLAYAVDGKPLPELKNAQLVWDITDFQCAAVARGTQAFKGARPVADKSFYEARLGKARKQNLHKPLVVKADAAHEVGREFFMHVALVADGRTLAEDTVTYAFVDPRPVKPADYGRAHFCTTYHGTYWSLADTAYREASIAAKLGIVWSQVYDYSWRKRQPAYPGPITFKQTLPELPRITYCPNMEQIRGRRDDHPWGSCATFCPTGATLPDPFRPKRTGFKIDPYVEYIVAYVRHHRQGIGCVVPSGLERPIDARTIELHRKAYKAIKSEFPDLPVGFMIYGLFANPSRPVEIFLKEKLYECSDFIDTHYYGSTANWSEWLRLTRTLEKLGRDPLPLVSTEFSVVSGSDQVVRARSMITGHLDAFAHGMNHIYYYNQSNLGSLPKPFLREPTELSGTRRAASGFMFLQRVDRARVSELIVPEDAKHRWAGGSYGIENPGQSLMPLLATVTYHNLIRNFDLATHRATVRPSVNALAQIFDRDDATVAAIWLANPVGFETFSVHAHLPFTAQDLFGRTQRITPRQGIALVAVDENPLTLVFDGPVPKLRFTKQQGGLAMTRVPRGGSGTVSAVIPPVYADTIRLRVACTVDGTWPQVAVRTATVGQGKATTVALPVRIKPDRSVGAYPLSARLYDGDAVVGLLCNTLRIDELLRADVEGIPVTATQDPAIRVVVRSLMDKPTGGTVRFVDRLFSPTPVPRVMERRYRLPARGSAEVRFPVPRAQVTLTAAYEITVDVHDDSGVRLTQREQIAFRATPHTPGPITIDGDLADWHLDRQVGVPCERQLTSWGKPYRGVSDIHAVVYTLWDKDHLYFAAVVDDDSSVVRANDLRIWPDDNIMLGLHPWGWKMGEPSGSGYYREHLGACADGTARVFRVGSPPGGPIACKGVKIAVRREKTRYLYEWAYPRATIPPMSLAPGARFRLSLIAIDRDGPDPGKGNRWPMGGVQLGGFNVNVDARPVKWREFVLTR